MAPFQASRVSRLPDIRRFKDRLKNQVDILKSEVPLLHAKNSPKKIHQLRVLTRRARASFAVLNKFHSDPALKSHVKILKTLTRVLGPVRARDVSEKDLKARLGKKGLKKNAPLNFLWQEMLRDKKQLRKAMGKKLARQNFAKKMKRSPFPDGNLQPHPGGFLKMLKAEAENALDTLKSHWKSFCNSSEMEDLHQLRISLKKWRYLMEIQAECTGFPEPSFFENLKSLQDRLGAIHDLEVLSEWLSQPKLKRRAASRRSLKPYQALRQELDLEIRRGLAAFRGEAAKLLVPLLKRRAA